MQNKITAAAIALDNALSAEAWAESQGIELEQFRREFSEQLRPERVRVVE